MRRPSIAAAVTADGGALLTAVEEEVDADALLIPSEARSAAAPAGGDPGAIKTAGDGQTSTRRLGEGHVGAIP